LRPKCENGEVRPSTVKLTTLLAGDKWSIDEVFYFRNFLRYSIPVVQGNRFWTLVNISFGRFPVSPNSRSTASSSSLMAVRMKR
jgi:hypothetical protein